MNSLDISEIHLFLFSKDFIYLFMRYTGTQVEGEAGSLQGAQRGTQSRVSRITPWAEGGAKPLSHLSCPPYCILNLKQGPMLWVLQLLPFYR